MPNSTEAARGHTSSAGIVALWACSHPRKLTTSLWHGTVVLCMGKPTCYESVRLCTAEAGLHHVEPGSMLSGHCGASCAHNRVCKAGVSSPTDLFRHIQVGKRCTA